MSNDLLIDKRILERNIKKGRLDPAEHRKLLDALPDLRNNVWRRPEPEPSEPARAAAPAPVAPTPAAAAPAAAVPAAAPVPPPLPAFPESAAEPQGESDTVNEPYPSSFG